MYEKRCVRFYFAQRSTTSALAKTIRKYARVCAKLSSSCCCAASATAIHAGSHIQPQSTQLIPGAPVAAGLCVLRPQHRVASRRAGRGDATIIAVPERHVKLLVVLHRAYMRTYTHRIKENSRLHQTKVSHTRSDNDSPKMNGLHITKSSSSSS